MENLGAEVDIANNGREALGIFTLQEKKYDVILMDVFMPFMNGIKATKRIRKFEVEKKLDKTPIIMITGNYTKFDRLKT